MREKIIIDKECFTHLTKKAYLIIIHNIFGILGKRKKEGFYRVRGK